MALMLFDSDDGGNTFEKKQWQTGDAQCCQSGILFLKGQGVVLDEGHFFYTIRPASRTISMGDHETKPFGNLGKWICGLCEKLQMTL